MGDPPKPDAKGMLRRCKPDELKEILYVINAAAVSYRGVISSEHWHEPYMSAAALKREIAGGVEFWACVQNDKIAGVMGFQSVRDVDLIRHAYVLPDYQGRGIGSQLLELLKQRSARCVLIGTWAAAKDAIRFYERHGFAVLPPDEAALLLRSYWDVPEAQIVQSVVLAESTFALGVLKDHAGRGNLEG